MLKIKELSFSGIGRFVEEQTITFDSLGNLVQVDGINNNTGGSSGAGKTTVFNALDFLFGLNKIPNTVLKSRLTDSGISVKGTFDLDGVPLVISRGKKLSITLDGVTTTGSAALSEEKLDEIIAIPRELFRKMLHKRQKEGGFFLQMTPSDIDKFLTNCLGLSDFKAKIEIVDKKVKELSEKKLLVDRESDSANAALKATKEAKAALLLPKKSVTQQHILDFKEKSNASAISYNECMLIHKKELEVLEASRPQLESFKYDASSLDQISSSLKNVREQASKLIAAEYSRQKQIKDNITSLKLEQSSLNHAVSLANNKKSELSSIASEIKKIRSSICPTCEQDWVTEKAKAAEAALLEKLMKARAVILEGEEAQKKILQIAEQLSAPTLQINESAEPEGLNLLKEKEKELDTLFEQERKKEKELSDLHHLSNKAKLSQFSGAQKVMQERHAVEISALRGQADIDRRTLDAAINQFKSYEEAKNTYDTYVLALDSKEADYTNKVSELAKLSTQMHNEISLADELKRALKSYLSCSFSDALETIGDNATKLIRGIPNMANATIQLEGTKETQDGKIKEEVTAVLHSDGEENIDIRSLSGGERTSLDLAIDLSVIDLIEVRANKGIDTLILDEPFLGLDTVSIEMALEMLKNSNISKRLIIVDHNPIIKESISDRIVVVRDGEQSAIQTK